MPKVYVIGGGFDFTRMFTKKRWELSKDLFSSDLVQFTGGSDVSPSFYDEKPHAMTNCNLIRDKRERIIFNIALKHKIPMSGVCRGGQFLNIMNGGKMWQHVDGHIGKVSHNTVDMATGESFNASSTHHQMMIPHKTGKIIATAKEATKKEKMGKTGQIISLLGTQGLDVEACFYLKSKSFCFQPHPEYEGFDNLTDRYFKYIAKYLKVE